MSTQEPEPTPSDSARTLTRRQLHDLVWTIPMRKLAESFGWSDSWLAKLCREFGVPTPERGYWAKKRSGKSVRRRRLSKKDDPEEVIFTWTDGVPDFEAEAKSVQAPQFDDDVAAKLKELEALDPVDHGSNGAELHPLVQAPRRKGRSSSTPKPPSASRCIFPVDVSDELLERALNALDVVVRSFERAGLTFVRPAKGAEDRPFVDVLGERFALRVEEPMKQRPFDPDLDGGEYRWMQPRVVLDRSGRLVLRLTGLGFASGRSWSDTTKRRIESVLDKVVRTAVRQVHAARRAKVEAEKRAEEQRSAHEQRMRDEAERRAEAERQQLEQNRVDALLAVGSESDRAERVRAFAVRCRGLAADANEDPVQDWLGWIEEVANRLDPLSEGLSALKSRLESDAQEASTKPHYASTPDSFGPPRA